MLVVSTTKGQFRPCFTLLTSTFHRRSVGECQHRCCVVSSVGCLSVYNSLRTLVAPLLLLSISPEMAVTEYSNQTIAELIILGGLLVCALSVSSFSTSTVWRAAPKSHPLSRLKPEASLDFCQSSLYLRGNLVMRGKNHVGATVSFVPLLRFIKKIWRLNFLKDHGKIFYILVKNILSSQCWVRNIAVEREKETQDNESNL